MGSPLNLSNKVYGRLTALYPTNKRKEGSILWACRCSCDNKIVKVQARRLKDGRIKSCGCWKQEAIGIRNTKHGANRVGEKHSLYRIWSGMKKRCYYEKNDNYAHYGGRGITVCDEWLNDYSAFRDYMLSLPNCPSNARISGIKLSREIDRINTDGNYEPGNVKWSTKKEQANNKTTTVYVPINGLKIPLQEAALRYAVVSAKIIRQRRARGWSWKKSFLTPLGKAS